MEESGSRRWVLSVVAALVVGAVLVTGWWLARPGSAGAGAGVAAGVAAGGGTSQQPADPGGGSARDPGPADVRTGDEPALGRDPVLVQDGVRIDGYAVRGDRLVLRYTTGVPECYGSVAAPQVVEEAGSVTVTLVSLPPDDPADACIDLAVVGTVPVELAAPLGQRAVVDGAFDPPVRVRRVAGGQVVPGEGS